MKRFFEKEPDFYVDIRTGSAAFRFKIHLNGQNPGSSLLTLYILYFSIGRALILKINF